LAVALNIFVMYSQQSKSFFHNRYSYKPFKIDWARKAEMCLNSLGMTAPSSMNRVTVNRDRLSDQRLNEGGKVSYEVTANRGKESAENLRVG